MMKKSCLIIILLLFVSIIYGQIQPIDVADLTFKVGSWKTKDLYYGFAEGDLIVFSFKEIKGKGIKEIEIIELPNNSVFMDFKTFQIKDKKIDVNKKSIYHFRFLNSSVAGKICKVKIQRIPKSVDLISFNTNWTWKNLYDTTYIPYTVDSLEGYDTLFYKEKVRELVKTEQYDDIIIDKNERVGDKSFVTPRNSYTYLSFTLPYDIIDPNREEETVAWAYWIGVGKEAQDAYKKNVQEIGKIASNLAGSFVSPLAGLAVGVVTTLFIPSSGDNVYYCFFRNEKQALAFKNGTEGAEAFDYGHGIAGYGKNTSNLYGTFYIGLHNDNNIQDIDVNIKIVVVREVRIYEDKEYDRQKITPRYITLHKKKMEVKTRQIRVNVD